MSWRDTVMTQTELYDKLDEVTARLDAAAEIIANSFESERPVDTAEAAIWLAGYEQAGEARVVEKPTTFDMASEIRKRLRGEWLCPHGVNVSQTMCSECDPLGAMGRV